MFSKLLGRRGNGGSGGRPSVQEKAIVHQSVPDEVLYPNGKENGPSKDMSWLDSNPSPTPKPPLRLKPEASVPVADPAPAPRDDAPLFASVRETTSEDISDDDAQGVSVNAAVAAEDGRPPFPYGWVVIVEGHGMGEWVPLYRGLSHIGSAEGQTVRLTYGDRKVAAVRHAALTYDETRHAFVLGGNAGFRVNGAEERAGTVLRDGDVFTIGTTSLRLVALCSQNFHWSEHIAPE